MKHLMRHLTVLCREDDEPEEDPPKTEGCSPWDFEVWDDDWGELT